MKPSSQPSRPREVIEVTPGHGYLKRTETRTTSITVSTVEHAATENPDPSSSASDRK